VAWPSSCRMTGSQMATIRVGLDVPLLQDGRDEQPLAANIVIARTSMAIKVVQVVFVMSGSVSGNSGMVFFSDWQGGALRVAWLPGP